MVRLLSFAASVPFAVAAAPRSPTPGAPFNELGPASVSPAAPGAVGSGPSATLNIEPHLAQSLLEDMLLGRVFEDKIAELYFKGRVAGFVHLYNGQEAVSTGIIRALRKDDYVVSTYRDHVHSLSKGMPAREVMAELYGKETGCSRGRGGSMHMFSPDYNVVGGFAFIGEQIPVALGTAFASVYRRSLADRSGPTTPLNSVTAVFMGDGTTNVGQFYESMNIASLAKLPVIFVVENNNWAIGMAHYRSTSSPQIYEKGLSFGIPSVQVDGMDVLAVRAAAIEAAERARAGYGPTLIEALTYRIRGHSVADPDELRPPAEKSSQMARDPIQLFAANVLQPLGISSEALIRLTKQKITAIVEDAVKFAEESPNPCPKSVADGIFSPAYQVPANGLDELSEAAMKEYADALREELRVKPMSRAEKKKLVPVYETSKPLKVID